jgi:hypothetical protein
MKKKGSVTKGKGRPEVYIMLAMGIEPMKLIEMGIPKGTVYKYNSQIKEIKQRINFYICNWKPGNKQKSKTGSTSI